MSPRQGDVGQKCRHSAVGPTCHRHVSNFPSQGGYNGIQRRFGGWDVEWCSILCKVEGWVLDSPRWPLLCSQGQETAIRLVVSLQRINFSCLCIGSPWTRVKTGCGIWALILSADTVLDMVAQSRRICWRESCMCQ